MATVIHLRRGTASDNPVLADGEPGFHTGTGEIRIGDGSTAWDDLPSTNRFLSEDILSGTYKKVLPLDLGDPHGWAAAQGSPTFDIYNHSGSLARSRQSMLCLVDGTKEGGLANITIPSTSPSWKIRVYWVYENAQTGDVQLTAYTTTSTAQNVGDNFTNEGTATILDDTVTDPGTDILQISEGTSQSLTGWRNINIATWTSSTMPAGEQIHILHAEIVEA